MSENDGVRFSAFAEMALGPVPDLPSGKVEARVDQRPAATRRGDGKHIHEQDADAFEAVAILSSEAAS
jgi:hypothetical protein